MSLLVLAFLLMVRGVIVFEVWGWGFGGRGRVGEVVDGRWRVRVRVVRRRWVAKFFA